MLLERISYEETHPCEFHDMADRMNPLKTLLPFTLCLLCCGPKSQDSTPTNSVEAVPSRQANEPEEAAKGTSLVEAGIRKALPAMQNYQELSKAESAPWLSASDKLWLAANGVCHPVVAEEDEGAISASLELCRRKEKRTTITCSYSFTLSQSALHSGSVSCDTVTAQGKGEGWGSGGPLHTLSLQSSDASSQVYSESWKLSVEADRHIVEEQACAPGSAEKAMALVVQETPKLDPEQELQRRFGVVGQSRRCQLQEGIRLSVRAENDRGSYDRGALGRRGSEAVDCTSTCPESSELVRIQEMNSWFEGKRFNKQGAPTTSMSIHPTKALCQAVASEHMAKTPQSDCKAP